MVELKNLFSKFTPSEEKKEFFLALEIANKEVTVAVWQVEEKVKTVSLGQKVRWDGQTVESLVSASDSALASALENLPEEPNEVVFGLPQTWVSDNKIVPLRLRDLKVLCQKLDFKPLGFVVTTEAIIQYLKNLEGAPLTAILIRVDKVSLSLTFVRLGKNLGTQVVGRSDNFADDVYEGLARFGQKETLPSRILLYDSNLENEKQALLAREWPESFFLHFPKVEILDPKIRIKAVAATGGEEAVRSLRLKKAIPAEKMGFLKDKDILEEKKEKAVIKKEKKKFRLPSFKTFKISLPKFKIKLPKWQLPKLKQKLSLPLMVGTGFVLLLILGGLALASYWYLPKAKVTIFFEAKNFEKKIKVTIDPELAVADFDKRIIPGEIVDVKMQKSEEKKTSGEKLVGDKAKGEVAVYNFTNDIKGFKKGTVIVGPDEKEFSLDVDIIVASASSEFDENWNQVISPGKTKVTVTALAIGPEYNLASGTEFNLQGHPSASFRAKNEKAFSGGTSRQVRVVAAEDQEKLLADLKAVLEKEIKSELANRAPEGKEILKEAILTSVVSREFSEAVGTEVDTLKLDLEMKAKALAYSPADLNNLLERVIAEFLPSGFVPKRKEIKPQKAEIDKEGKAVFEAFIKADLVPDLDQETIKSNLLGKYPGVAQEYLENLTGFVRAEIVIRPQLPARLRTLPRLAKNIDIKMEVKD